MKYCKKCGMLLEDNMEICIGCGNDVSKKDSCTAYPEHIQAQIDAQKKESRRKLVSILAIIAIFIALAVIISMFVSTMYRLDSYEEDINSADREQSAFSQRLLDTIQESETPILNDDGEIVDVSADITEAETVVAEEAVDSELAVESVVAADDLGNEVFTACYPVGLNNVNYSVEYARGSIRFPSVFSFVASNNSGTAQLTYTSPQHYQYLSGVGLDEVQNVMSGYISFYDFESVDNYLDTIIRQAYPNHKKVELVKSVDAGGNARSLLDTAANKLANENADLIALGFGLSEQTKLTLKQSLKEAKIYSYRIVNADSQAVNADFYVPVVVNIYEYTDPKYGISGELKDTYILSLVSFEAGSDALYEEYPDAFAVFANTANLNKNFFDINELYSIDIQDALLNGRVPKSINNSMLSSYNDLVGNSYKLTDANGAIGKLLSIASRGDVYETN